MSEREPRIFKVDSPHMKGDDIGEWQQWLKMTFNRWDIDYPIRVDKDYGVGTRAASASMCMAMGLASAESAMKEGVTPELRTKLRHRRLTAAERVRFETTRRAYRAALRKRYDGGGVASPTPKVLADSWGYHPGVHDGMDIITPANAPIYAICEGTIVRVSSSGWWGKAPSGDVSKGDGIIILRATKAVGPIKRGMNIGYGHAENATVREGEFVRAGDRIGNAGLAVAWHIHFMVNMGSGERGVGDRDPRPIYNYCRKFA